MKIVLIGLGRWGEKNARVLSELGILVAVYDFDSQKVKEFGEKLSVNYYDSIDRIMVSESFDAAFLDSSVSKSVEIATKLLYEKKHVFVENPIIHDSINGEKLKELSIKKRVVFSCEFDDQLNPAVKQVKNFVREKRYGDLKILEFYRESLASSENNDSIVLENTLKDIETVNEIFGEMPVVVFAIINSNNENKNFASIMLGYKENKTGIILSNNNSSKQVRSIRAICSGGLIFSNLISQEIKCENENSCAFPKEDSILLQIQNFIQAIEEKNETMTSPGETINAVKIVEAAFLSSKQGVPIYLDLK